MRTYSLWFSKNGIGLLVLLVTLIVSASAKPAQPTKAKPAQPPLVRFARDVRPILSDNCFKCHGFDPKTRAANLRLDTEEGAFAALSSGRAFVAGKPQQSRAFLRMTEKNPALRMPPPDSHRKLSAAQIDLVRRWIAQGAKYEKHWAFMPPVRVPLPKVKNAAQARNPVDLFLLEKLEARGLKFSPEANKETLLRRVTLDLTGLPPTLNEIDAFLTDKSPNAYGKVVDRLLASPRFGERMAWEWLDAARYADTNGYQEDRYRPMWPWRDWVMTAFNRNLPFDQFTTEQIAGDLLPNATPEQRLATGFNRNHMLNGEGGRIPEESRVEYVKDRVDTTTTLWLGLTMACAQCHDHKFDPLAQKEYYRFYSYFNNVAETGGIDKDGVAFPAMPYLTGENAALAATIEKQIGEAQTQLDNADAANKPGAQQKLDGLKKQLAALNANVPQVMIMQDRPTPREAFVMIRGAYDKPGEKVTSGVPAVLNALPSNAPENRLGLAQWLTSLQNPLTARVAVNRLWQTLFGVGLVKTAEDFGAQGDAPSHPDLLDWLATEYVRLKWDTKALIRLLVSSAAYRQSSSVTPALLQADPDNRLYARAPRYRLPAFMLRDQALAVSGLLVEKFGGAPVKPYQPEGVWEDFSYGKITYQQDHGEALYRRSIYTFWRRSVAPTTLFDTASRRVCQVRLARTNTPLQSLTLLNDITYAEASRILAERIMKEGGASPASRLNYAFRLITGRRLTAAEQTILSKRLQTTHAYYRANLPEAEKLLQVGEKPRDKTVDTAELAAYTAVMSVILNLDEVQNKE
jgi:mono/diheme cytochrome c family protein